MVNPLGMRVKTSRRSSLSPSMGGSPVRLLCSSSSNGFEYVNLEEEAGQS
jgi:hypothetical protein